MLNELIMCKTPSCLSMSHHLYCLRCSAQEAKRRSLLAAEGTCAHGHSITGDFELIKRFLPEYKGSHPQEGYMLDVCKACLQELHERPYNPSRAGRGPQR